MATTAVNAGFEWVEGPAGRFLECKPLRSLASHTFSTRQLAFTPPSRDQDYQRLGEQLRTDADAIIRVSQVHGRAIALVRPGESLLDAPAADAIISTDPDRAICVRVADCVPVLVADKHRRLVAAVHAGWRGTCAGVTAAVVAAIRNLGVPPSDLVAAIGPCIGPCCYQVTADVRDAFLAEWTDRATWFADDGPNRWKLDLWRANLDQLTDAGVPSSTVHVSGICTADNLADCFSYRREGPGTGRLVAAIRLDSRSA
jgi:polyphenol oxidase